MLVIAIQFTAGRFHATSWGRHVNEGVPEWPPSPYRLLRALYDAWKRKRPDWSVDRVESLLVALSTTPPYFSLPKASAAHTRAFLSQNEKDSTKRQRIFDAFVVLNPTDVVRIGWPDVTLNDQQFSDLIELLSLLNYVGRSESWVTASACSDASTVVWNCTPADSNAPQYRSEQLPVACAIGRESYASRPYISQVIPKRRAKAKEPQTSSLPWIDALAWTTGDLLRSRRSEPPAMRYVKYLRRTDCFQVEQRKPDCQPERVVNGVLYALESKVPPSVLATIEIAERYRRKVMGIHKRLVGDETKVSRKFSGKDTDGNPLKGHRHMFLLPLDRDNDGLIDHLVAVSREALDQNEQLALDRVESLWQSRGRPDIRLVPVSWGRRDQLFLPVTRYRSATPFVPPRHWRRGRGNFEDWLTKEVAREAVNHGLPAPAHVAILPMLTLRGGRTLRWIQFRRNRKNARVELGYGFELEFDKPVVGPVALGYGCHFGLGQFVSM